MSRPQDKPASGRLGSIDAYRGFVMFLMMAEVLHLSGVARAFPDSAVWKFLAFHQSHVEWVGCSLHDLIQPSFSFLVGVALPFSIASRLARGQSRLVLTGHALWRSLLLIALGIFLRSVGAKQTNFTFEDTLTQIGLGYTFLFLLGLGSTRGQWIALVTLLVAYWGAWAAYPLPGADFDHAALAGVPPDWAHKASGFAAHWNKNTNLGAAFDRWFLNLFPRAKPFFFNGGGYLTLSFIPTLGTMIFGLIAGNWLRRERPPVEKLKHLVIAGLACLGVGLALHGLGVCPIVKRIWTPAWTIFSAGCCFLFLAGFHAVIDLHGWRRWAFPLTVIGMNSIAAYCMAHLIDGFIISTFKTHLGANAFQFLGDAFAPLFTGVALLLVLWLILYWMYRRKLFLKI